MSDEDKNKNPNPQPSTPTEKPFGDIPLNEGNRGIGSEGGAPKTTSEINPAKPSEDDK